MTEQWAFMLWFMVLAGLLIWWRWVALAMLVLGLWVATNLRVTSLALPLANTMTWLLKGWPTHDD